MNERIGNLNRHPADIGSRQRVSVGPSVERLTLNVFRCHEPSTGSLPNLINGGNVAVLEGQRSLGPLHDALHPLRIGESSAQYPEHNFKVSFGIAGEVESTLASKAPFNPVLAKLHTEIHLVHRAFVMPACPSKYTRAAQIGALPNHEPCEPQRSK
jgi:hypothetical protein